MHQMPPTSSFSNFLTMLLLTSTPFTPRLPSSASYTSRFSLSVTVTLSMTLRLPRSRIDGLDLLGFVGPDVVLGQNLLDRLQALLDHRLVVRGAVAAEQVFQDVDRHVRPFLDQLGQVLADDLAGEVPVEQVVQAGVECRWFQKSSVNALSIITSTLCCSMPVSASRRTRR